MEDPTLKTRQVPWQPVGATRRVWPQVSCRPRASCGWCKWCGCRYWSTWTRRLQGRLRVTVCESEAFGRIIEVNLLEPQLPRHVPTSKWHALLPSGSSLLTGNRLDKKRVSVCLSCVGFCRTRCRLSLMGGHGEHHKARGHQFPRSFVGSKFFGRALARCFLMMPPFCLF